ncbi:MAG TPA: substrate-binding domain-containing protein, partial [Paracoccaceae bacterium]|nr:substrate-binding domain-containing protein [Paracoccaceae bacterium]
LRRRPEAIVVTGGTHTERCRRLLANAGVPVVETWDLPRHPIGHVVGFSNAEAARLMVEHFWELGYRRIGFIGGDASRDTRGLDRRRGFVEALRAHGLEDGRLVAGGPPPITMREGAAAMREMRARWPDVQAVMCVSDLSAFGAMTECQRAGLRVPQDIAIAGFGAYDLAEYAIPPITTVDVGARAIGRHTAETVLRLLGGEHGAAVRLSTSITPRLIARPSTLAAGR